MPQPPLFRQFHVHLVVPDVLRLRPRRVSSSRVIISVRFSVRWLWINMYNICGQCHSSKICQWQVYNVMHWLYLFIHSFIHLLFCYRYGGMWVQPLYCICPCVMYYFFHLWFQIATSCTSVFSFTHLTENKNIMFFPVIIAQFCDNVCTNCGNLVE